MELTTGLLKTAASRQRVAAAGLPKRAAAVMWRPGSVVEFVRWPVASIIKYVKDKLCGGVLMFLVVLGRDKHRHSLG